MADDGAYSDAEWHNGPGTIGIVLVLGGNIVEQYGKPVDTENSHEAEIAGILWARQMFPGHVVYNDSQSAARECGAIWIPREQNKAAHRAARIAYLELRPPINPCDNNKQQKLKKKFRNRGRGVMPASAKRAFSWMIR